MRVAIVGGNLLGCASAFYTRQALDANRGDAGEEAAGPEDEIVIFEKLPRSGGNKFVTMAVDGTEIPVGTASGADVVSGSALKALLENAGIALPEKKPPREWAVFDWDKDEYRLDRTRSQLLSAISESAVLSGMLQLFALLSALFFGKQLWESSLEAFVGIDRRDNRYLRYPLLIWFAFSALLGFGVIPVQWLARLYNWFIFQTYVKVVAQMSYGGQSISTVGTIVSKLQEQLATIVEEDCASSCVTLGHLLSSCGLGKYVRMSSAELLGKYQVQQSFLDDCIAPGMAQTYGDLTSTPDHNSNALACLLNMIVRCPLPRYLRWRARYFNAEDTVALCPKLASLARAEIVHRTEVMSVNEVSKGNFELIGVSDGQKGHSLGSFDAVILAAVVDPVAFTTDALEEDIGKALSLNASVSSRVEDGQEVKVMNTAKFVSVIKGKLKTSFVKKSTPSAVATHVTVLNSVNCSELLCIGPDMYRIVSGEKPVQDSVVLDTMFESTSSVETLERVARPYKIKPLRVLDGVSSPSFIWGTKFLNAACVDRICNDVNMDCLAAKNAASFFRDGVATWK